MEDNYTPTASLPMLKNKLSGKKEYQKNYQKLYRQRKWRKEVVFTIDEKRLIVKSADTHKHNPAEHIRQCTLAYIGKSYLNPSEDLLKELRYELRKVGVNINQIAYKVNAKGREHFNEHELHARLAELEKIIERFVCQPLEKDSLHEAAVISRATIQNIQNTLTSS